MLCTKIYFLSSYPVINTPIYFQFQKIHRCFSRLISFKRCLPFKRQFRIHIEFSSNSRTVNYHGAIHPPDRANSSYADTSNQRTNDKLSAHHSRGTRGLMRPSRPETATQKKDVVEGKYERARESVRRWMGFKISSLFDYKSRCAPIIVAGVMIRCFRRCVDALPHACVCVCGYYAAGLLEY